MENNYAIMVGMIVIGIVVGLVILTLLVVAHEWGHFIMARKNGVEVKEFGIGFPPRAVAWRKVDGKWRRIKRADWDNMPGEGLVLSLNWLPIGGFCQMKDESDAATSKGSFGRASLWEKTKILFGGVAMNWLVAALILTILAWTGMPHFLDNQFEISSDVRIERARVKLSEVVEGSPAFEAGLESGDEILYMHSEGVGGDCGVENLSACELEVIELSDVNEFDAKYADQSVKIIYDRGGVMMETDWFDLGSAEGDYVLGVVMSQDSLPLYRSTWSAPIVGVGTTLQLTGETFRGIGELLWNLASGVVKQVNFDAGVRESGVESIEKAGNSVSGPIGIIGVLFPTFMQSGLTNLAFLTAIISISLACMNVLPVPVLDGGRWLLIMIYRLRKKKLTRETEEKIVSRAFLVLIALILLITVIDITRIFG